MKNDIFEGAKKYVNKLLLPMGDYYYHSYDHSLEVMSRAMYLAKEEGLCDEDAEILGLAGLFHDTGFVIQYDNNEPIGAKIAKNYLKSVLYPADKIKKIEKLILATNPNVEPTNIYEEIIKDADLDNLGREDFLEKGNNLKREIELVKNIKIKDPDWVHASAELLKDYSYRTQTAKKEREKGKESNLKKIGNEIKKEEV